MFSPWLLFGPLALAGSCHESPVDVVWQLDPVARWACGTSGEPDMVLVRQPDEV